MIRGTASYKHAHVWCYISYLKYIALISSSHFLGENFLKTEHIFLRWLIDIRYMSMDGFIHVQVHAYMHTRSFHWMYAMHPHIILLFVSQYKLLNQKPRINNKALTIRRFLQPFALLFFFMSRPYHVFGFF